MEGQGERIFYGSLELQERNRLAQDNRSDTTSISNASTRVSMTPPTALGQKSRPTEFLAPTAEASEAKKRHEEMLKKYELQKKSKSIMIPTNDDEIKRKLRELKQVVTYFGETAADRRERLRAVVARVYIEKGEYPSFAKSTVAEVQSTRDEENELFYYEGPPELRTARLEIAQHSLKQAALRVEKSKIKKATMDPLEEDDIIDRELQQIHDFEISMCQFADSSCVSKGVFSPSGDYFATSGWSGICKLWNIPDCSLKTTLLGHTQRCIDITFHPFSGISAGVKLATCGTDNTVRLWSLEEDSEYQKSNVLKGHEDRVNKVRFHPMGKHLISTSHDKTWKLWDIETKKALLTQTGHSRPLYSCSLQPDGSILLTGDLGGYGQLWDLRTGKAILPITGHVKQIISSDFHPNGYHLVTGSDDNTVRFWDIRRKNCFNILPAHTKLISDVKFQPGDARFLATASYDKSCKIWTSKDWTLTRTLVAHDSKVTSISISNDMQYLATTSLDRKWMLWSKKNKNVQNNIFE
jgi:U4/U6 small nuclear ribonucleoprotein PRP4